MSTARTTSPRTAPTDLPTWAIQAEDLEAMLATDDDTVDTAVIPRLAYREAVEALERDSVLAQALGAAAHETAPPHLRHAQAFGVRAAPEGGEHHHQHGVEHDHDRHGHGSHLSFSSRASRPVNG